ncbi:hypothetical protein KNE206_65380 [Kitasatospora sp. NE20-6]
MDQTAAGRRRGRRRTDRDLGRDRPVRPAARCVDDDPGAGLGHACFHPYGIPQVQRVPRSPADTAGSARPGRGRRAPAATAYRTGSAPRNPEPADDQNPRGTTPDEWIRPA